MPSIEKLRFVSSGTEATMSAIRVARAFTGRKYVIKFEGCYHGHSDGLLVKAGSGPATFGLAGSAGVPQEIAHRTLPLPFNDLAAVEEAFAEHPDEIACVIVEPVVGNMGCVAPAAGYLEGLRRITRETGSLLIFDEVMTGFRLAIGGAQQVFGIDPDLSCLGKIIGGGLPCAAFGGKARMMDLLAPLGPVYQAGTLSGNPLAMAAGIATLRYLSAHKWKSMPSWRRAPRRSLRASPKRPMMLESRWRPTARGPWLPGFSTPARSPTLPPRLHPTRKLLAAFTGRCSIRAYGCRPLNSKRLSSAPPTPLRISTSRLRPLARRLRRCTPLRKENPPPRTPPLLLTFFSVLLLSVFLTDLPMRKSGGAEGVRLYLVE